ncbi:MAG: 50S ribosomal protein L25, partial [Spirochaetales bacterium]
MEKKTLNIDLREERKKGPAGRLRRMGKIPAIIYGHGEPTAISVDEHEFNKKFHTVSENTIINLRTGDHDYDVLVKDYQSDILTGRIKHLDFFEIDRKKLLKTHVPIRLTGTSIGVREGGLLEHLLHDAEVECLPKDMPEEYVLDITNL